MQHKVNFQWKQNQGHKQSFSFQVICESLTQTEIISIFRYIMTRLSRQSLHSLCIVALESFKEIHVLIKP